MHKLIRTILIVTFASAGLMLSACNTTKGFGQDVQASGQAIQKAANNAKN